MIKSPRAAFGMLATTVAMKAKAGTLKPDSIGHLIDLCLLHVGEDAGAMAATLQFVRTHKANPIAAGNALQDFVLEWTGDIDARRPSEVLAQIERERATKVWRGRADLR